VRKAVTAFANAIGGYPLIGVRRDVGSRSWIADGVAFGENVEPAVWAGNVIRNGVSPVPRFDVRSWATAAGAVAVIRIEPVPVMPCMTSNGEVFERVSGESVKVTDPAVLQRLYERGWAAETLTLAEAAIGRALERERISAPPWPPYLKLTLARCPTGKPDDVAETLFAPTFEATLRDTWHALPSEPLEIATGTPQLQVEVTQGYVAAVPVSGGGPKRQEWSIVTSWDSSVTLTLFIYRATTTDDHASLLASAIFEDAVAPAARASERLVQALGGYGRAHVALLVEGERYSIRDEQTAGPVPGIRGMRPIQTWTAEDGSISDQRLERMRREFLRACGIRALEPD
jgi:hypothetical protein